MRKVILIFLFSIIYVFVFGQNNPHSNILRDFGLPSININDKNLDKESTKDFNLVFFDLKDNKIFKRYTLFYDELDELEIAHFEMTSSSFKKNQPFIIETILKYFTIDTVYTDVLGDKVTVYKNGENLANLIENRSKPKLELKIKNNVKVKSKYDEFNKTTSLFPINVSTVLKSDNDIEYYVNFLANKEKQQVWLSIISDSKEWKFIESVQILLSNKDVKNFTLTTKREVSTNYGVSTSEKGIALIPLEFCKSILNSQFAKLKINGSNKTGIVTLNSTQLSALSKLVKEIE